MIKKKERYTDPIPLLLSERKKLLVKKALKTITESELKRIKQIESITDYLDFGLERAD